MGKNKYYIKKFTYILLIIFFLFTVCSIFVPNLHAEDITIDQDNVWTSGTFRYDNVIITNNAALTFDGLVTLEAQSIIIDTGSSISANGKGYLTKQGPGAGTEYYASSGGGYGGKGGDSTYSNVGGETYGSATVPVDPGSGGGIGPGGGAIRLITDSLTIDGVISANGQENGSGGSIYITATSISGSGLLRANGGTPSGTVDPKSQPNAGGGGGRIAIYYSASNFSGNSEVKGGSGIRGGGNGEDGTILFVDVPNNTISFGHSFRFQENDSPFNLDSIILNNSTVTTQGNVELNAADFVMDSSSMTVNDALTINVPALSVRNNSVLMLNGNENFNVNSIEIVGNSVITHVPEGKININVPTITVDTGSSISANGKGYLAKQGPGAGTEYYASSGGGYGGKGGDSTYGNVGGETYGSATAPVDPGSGGGIGPGGGAIRLITDSLTIDGVISANGQENGSGGSIYITATSISGSGLLRANGGTPSGTVDPRSQPNAGGGGGRIAIYYSASNFSGNSEVKGGSGIRGGGNGEDGTILFVDVPNNTISFGHSFRFQENDSPFNLDSIILNNSTVTTQGNVELNAADFVMDSSSMTVNDALTINVPALSVRNNSVLMLNGNENFNVNSIEIVGNSVITHVPEGKININVPTITVDTGSSISANGKGYLAKQGPGAGTEYYASSGGGYGGKGGDSTYGNVGGETYGSATAPVDPGSGGGIGPGGGAIRLITDSLTIDGIISANGQENGSGGSIYIITYSLSGSGVFTANGGTPSGTVDPRSQPNAGGGGGRIAIFCTRTNFSGNSEVKGGSGIRGGGNGQDGTLNFSQMSFFNPIQLTPGVEYQGNINLNFLEYFTLDAEKGSLLLIELIPRSGINAVVLYDEFSEYVTKSPTARGRYELLIPIAKSDTYRFVLYGKNVDVAGGSYSITARYMSQGYLSDISTNSAVNQGNVTLTLTGLGFTEDMQVALSCSGGAPITPAAITVASGTEIYATFDLNGVLPCNYDVVVYNEDGTVASILEDALDVTGDGMTGHLKATISVPAGVRRGRTYTGWINYENDGSTDLETPVFNISNDAGLSMKLSPYEVHEEGPIDVMGYNHKGLANILPPGSKNSIPFSFRLPNNAGQRNMKFLLGKRRVSSTPVGWGKITDSQLRPDDMEDDAWAVIISNLKSQMGVTWQDVNKSLGRFAAMTGRHRSSRKMDLTGGEMVTRPTYNTVFYGTKSLIEFELAKATALISPRKILASAMDVYVPAPGMPLAFGRVAYQSIPSRFRDGPLGRGWSHTYEYTATTNDKGDVLIKRPGNGYARIFKPTGNGGYQGLPNDFANLTIDQGVYILREKDGTILQFQATGQLSSIQDTNGNTLSFTYSGDDLTGIAHSNGESISIGYNGQGHISQINAPGGQVITYQYDSSGEHLIEVEKPGGNITQYTYNPADETPSAHAMNSIIIPHSTTYQYTYDERGRLASEGNESSEKTTYSYDKVGTVTITDINGSRTVMRFGSKGELLEVRDPNGALMKGTFDDRNQRSGITAPDGSTVSISHDARGNPTGIKNARNQIVKTSFDSNSRLTRLVDAKNNAMNYGYDSSGNLTSITYPDTSLESFDYDTSGKLDGYTNRRNEFIDFTTNSRGQITQKVYPDGRVIDYAYNDRGNLISANDSLTGEISMQYNDRNALTRIDYPGGYWFTFEYDNAGRRQKRTSHDSQVINYEYDEAGRLEALTDGNGASIISYTYDANGRLSTETKGNGTQTTYEYDPAGQLEHMINYGPGGVVQSRFDYTYDVNGNRTAMTTLDGTTRYEYDDIGQLTGVTYPDDRSVSYEYDDAGNRKVVSDDGAVTDYTTNNMNQYTHVDADSYDYDTDGNMTSKTNAQGTTTYQYDAENRLSLVVLPSGETWEYIYDALGNRMMADKDGNVTRYVHDPAGLVDVAAEYDGNGALVARYTHGLGLVARVASDGSGAYYAFDGIGHTRQMTDGAGAVVNSYDYSPFDKALVVDESVDNPFQYVGRFGVMAEGNGLTFMRARYYSGELGRFVSEDPIGIMAGDVNFYRYCRNDPTNNIDPVGLVDDATKNIFFSFSLKELFEFADNTVLKNRNFIRGWEKFSKTCNYFKTAANIMGKGFSIVNVYSTFQDYKLGLASGSDLAHALALGISAFTPWSFYFSLYDSAIQYIGEKIGARGEWFLDDTFEILDGWISDLIDSITTTGIWSSDPNEKSGPIGVTEEHRYITAGTELNYTIYFENLASATGPAQEVFIHDFLDEDLDWSTFKLKEVAFGDKIVTTMNGKANCDEMITHEDLAVTIDAIHSLETGLVSWTLRSIDPETGELPEDAFAGFLPPEDGTGRGQGYVTFSVRSKDDLPAGTLITNRANIVFDTNTAIQTNEWINTITDAAPAASSGPYILDGATDVSIYTVLGFAPSDFAASYDLYLWEADQNKPDTPTGSDLKTPFFDAYIFLTYGTTYSWQAVAKNVMGSAESAVWSFTTEDTPQYTIKGTVTSDGAGISGVVLNGLPGNPVTDAVGHYTAAIAMGWSGAVTPQKKDYTFMPESRSYTDVSGNQTSQDYAVGDRDNDGRPDDRDAFPGNPNEWADSDNDGMGDNWEISHFGNLDRDGTGDFDGDGISDLDEFLNDTDPKTSNAPTIPIISLPEDKDEVTMLQPVLTVENSTDPDGDIVLYNFEVYSDEGMMNHVSGQVNVPEATDYTSWKVGEILNDNTWYYWRVRATDGKGFSQWAYGSFFVNTQNDPPGAFNISSPQDETEVDNQTPVLSVTNSADVDEDVLTYAIEVYSDDLMSTLVASAYGIPEDAGGTTSWSVNPTIDDNTWYFWRSIATDEHGAQTDTAISSFFVNTFNDAPEHPDIISPAVDSEVKALELDLAITNAVDLDEDVLTYFFELDTINTFDSPDLRISGEISEGTDTTGWYVDELDDNTGYFWRAKANDGYAESPWSLGNFFVNIFNDLPSVPTLNNPGEGAWVDTLTPVLALNPSIDLDNDGLIYRFEIYTDQELAELFAAVESDTTEWVVSPALDDNVQYFWRAQAEDEHGAAGGWMAIASFFTDSNGIDDPPEISIVEPSDDIYTNADTFLIRWEDSDPDSNADISLFYSTDLSGLNGTLIQDGIMEDPDGDDDTLVWDISAIAEGTYYIYGTISDDITSASAYCPGSITIDRTSPIVSAVPAGGKYVTPVTVTLEANKEADIYYTLDNTDPGIDSILYEAPVNISETTTLKFMGVDKSGNKSAIRTEVYTIAVIPNKPPAADAGEDIFINLGQTAVLDGSASKDPDSGPGPLTFNWIFVDIPAQSSLASEDLNGFDTPNPSFLPDVEGVYTLELMVDDGEDSHYDDVRVTAVSGRHMDLSGFSVFGLKQVWVDKYARVVSGDIGVMKAGHASGFNISIMNNVYLADNVSLYGNFIKIGKRSSVDDVYYNYLKNKGTIRGEHFTPLELPLEVDLPEFPEPDPGKKKLHIPWWKKSLVLGPGSYGDVIVRSGGTLFLTGGEYHIRNLVLGSFRSKVVFKNRTDLIIKKNMISGKRAYIGPDNGSGIDAEDVRIYVNGRNCLIGHHNTLNANIYAPNGSIILNKGTIAEGAFIGNKISVGRDVVIKLDNGF